MLTERIAIDVHAGETVLEASAPNLCHLLTNPRVDAGETFADIAQRFDGALNRFPHRTGRRVVLRITLRLAEQFALDGVEHGFRTVGFSERRQCGPHQWCVGQFTHVS